MADNFNFYNDAGLTQLNSPSTPRLSSITYDGTSGNVDYTVWYGSPATGRVIQASSNPGVDQVSVDVTAASGTGLPEQPSTFVKLALTQPGLDTGGQSLNLGTSILGGVSNAVPIWVRENVSNGVGVSATYNNLSLVTCPLAESAT
jgi:hypothetical protein